VEQTVKQIGYPRWNKMMNVKKSSAQGKGASTDSVNLYYIPFVRDQENFVNASMIIKTTAEDTTFGYLCDWQYKNFGFDSTSTNWTARNVFHIFALLDKSVFARTRFKILDSNLISSQVATHIHDMGLTFSTTDVFYTLDTNSTSRANRSSFWLLTTECNSFIVCVPGHYGKSFVLSACPPGQIPLIETICTDVWVYIPSSGDGGNNSGTGNPSGTGGSGGGGTPPNCNGGLNKGQGFDHCTPGWEPEYIGDEINYSPNIFDTIGISYALKSTYPCFANFLKDTLPNTNGFTQRILYNLFGVSSRIHLTYDIDFRLTKDSADALTDPAQISYDPAVNPRVYKFSTTIRLNPWLLDSAAYEYNVATAIHEGIHAFIDQMFTQIYITDPATITTYFSLFLYYYTQNQNYTNPTLQHYEIASKYLDSVTNVVRHYYRGAAPNEQWKDSVSRALAWGGLSATNVWLALPSNEKCRIASINLAARDISSQGGIINIPGITCGLFPNSRFDSLKLSLPCY